MKKTLKQFTAVLLSLMLAFGAMPFTAFAAMSGDCGTDVHWALSQDGTLSITGSGEMENYTSSTYAPWDDSSDAITKITVSSGVTKIGNYAFYDLKYVTEVQLSEGLQTIGQYAFAYCESLEEITLPATLNNIVTGAFKDSAIKSVTFLGDSITSIGNAVFNTSSGLNKAKVYIKEGFKVAGTTVNPSDYGSAPFYKNYVGYTNGKSTVYWMNDDGTVLEIDTNVVAGTTPTYDGTEPSKEGYDFAGWNPAPSATVANEIHIYTATFEQTTTNAILDFGTGHEALAASFAASKGYTISGSQVTIPYQGATKSEVMDELVFDAISLWSDSLIDEGECLYSMFNLGSKPLSDYENEEELRTELNTASQIASADGDVYYLLWNQPYEGDASITFTAPHIGTEIVTRNYGSIATDHSEPQPEISFSGVVCNMPQGFSWFTSYTDGDSFPNNRFVGTIEGNTVYYTAAYITAPFGYYISDTDAITVNGAQNSWFVETDAANSPGMYTVIAGVMPSDHTYGNPVWVWDGITSASAKFSCSECDFEETVEATVTQNADKISYTATVVYNGVTYTDVKYKEEPTNSYSITVENGVAVNFYIDVPFYDAEGGRIEYTYIADSDEMSTALDTKSVNIDDLPEMDDGTRKLTLKVAPAQLGQVLEIEVYNAGGENVATISDSAANYCKKILDNEKYSDLHALAQALLNYGQLAKEYFGYDDGYNIPYDEEHYKDDVTVEGAQAALITQGDVQFTGITYIAQLNPEFRFYLKDVTSEEQAKAISVSIDNGLTAEVAKVGGKYCVRVTGLKASEFGTKFTLTAGTTVLEYNGYKYLDTVLTNEQVTDENLKNLAKGVYRYAKAIEALQA